MTKPAHLFIHAFDGGDQIVQTIHLGREASQRPDLGDDHAECVLDHAEGHRRLHRITDTSGGRTNIKGDGRSDIRNGRSFDAAISTVQFQLDPAIDYLRLFLQPNRCRYGDTATIIVSFVQLWFAWFTTNPLSIMPHQRVR